MYVCVYFFPFIYLHVLKSRRVKRKASTELEEFGRAGPVPSTIYIRLWWFLNCKRTDSIYNLSVSDMKHSADQVII